MKEVGKDANHTWYSRTSSPSIQSVAPKFRLTRSQQEQLWQHAYLIWKQILENPVYQKKEELLSVLNQKCIIVFGYRIKSEYSQCLHSKTNKKSRTSLRSTYHVWTLKIFRKWSSLKIIQKCMPQLPKNRTCTFVGFYTLIRFLFVISIH